MSWNGKPIPNDQSLHNSIKFIAFTPPVFSKTQPAHLRPAQICCCWVSPDRHGVLKVQSDVRTPA